MAQLDMLFKKQFGVVDAHPMAPFSVEPVVSSRPSVMADQQLWAQSVPTTAPTDLVSATFTNPGVAGGTKQTSTAKSYIAKYTGCALATGVNGTSSGVSYTFSGATNYLTDVIPFNYDPMGGYTVSVSVGGINTLMTDATNPWVLDADAGYLIFLGSAAISTAVTITYWRYEGTKGLSGTIAASAVSASGAIVATGNVSGQQTNDTLVNTIGFDNAGYTAGIKAVIPDGFWGDAVRMDLFNPRAPNDNIEATRVSIMPFTGNVGIGVSTPQYKLDVVGGIHASVVGTAGSRVPVNSTTTLLGDANTSYFVQFTIVGGGGGGSSTRVGGGGCVITGVSIMPGGSILGPTSVGTGGAVGSAGGDSGFYISYGYGSTITAGGGGAGTTNKVGTVGTTTSTSVFGATNTLMVHPASSNGGAVGTSGTTGSVTAIYQLINPNPTVLLFTTSGTGSTTLPTNVANYLLLFQIVGGGQGGGAGSMNIANHSGAYVYGYAVVAGGTKLDYSVGSGGTLGTYTGSYNPAPGVGGDSYLRTPASGWFNVQGGANNASSSTPTGTATLSNGYTRSQFLVGMSVAGTSPITGYGGSPAGLAGQGGCVILTYYELPEYDNVLEGNALIASGLDAQNKVSIASPVTYSQLTTANPVDYAQLTLKARGTGSRLYMANGFTSGAGTASMIQSADYYDSEDNGTGLLINPLGGNVGIGTTTPAYKLDVAGTGKFTGALTTGSINPTSQTLSWPLDSGTTNYVLPGDSSMVYTISVVLVGAGGMSGTYVQSLGGFNLIVYDNEGGSGGYLNATVTLKGGDVINSVIEGRFNGSSSIFQFTPVGYSTATLQAGCGGSGSFTSTTPGAGGTNTIPPINGFSMSIHSNVSGNPGTTNGPGGASVYSAYGIAYGAAYGAGNTVGFAEVRWTVTQPFANTFTGETRVNGSLAVGSNLLLGNGIPDYNMNGYNALGLSGGNSMGFLFGSFDTLGDAIHLSYNYLMRNDGQPTIPRAVAGTSMIDLQYGGISFDTGAVNTTPTSRIFINSSGYVGIGTVAPTFPLHVTPSVSGSGGGGWIFGGGTTSMQGGTQTGAVSIYTPNYVLAQGMIFTSDQRMKQNISSFNTTKALEMIRTLEPVSYNWIDPSKGTRDVVGFIAQQVEKHIPDAVHTISDDVPDVFSICNISSANYTTSSQTLYLSLTDPQNAGLSSIQQSTILSMFLNDNTQIFGSVSAIEHSTLTLTLDKPIPESARSTQIFVYGEQVNDLHAIRQDQLFALNVAATQAIDGIVQNQSTLIGDLQTTVAQQSAQISTLLAKL